MRLFKVCSVKILFRFWKRNREQYGCINNLFRILICPYCSLFWFHIYLKNRKRHSRWFNVGLTANNLSSSNWIPFRWKWFVREKMMVVHLPRLKLCAVCFQYICYTYNRARFWVLCTGLELYSVQAIQLKSIWSKNGDETTYELVLFCSLKFNDKF